MRREFILFLLGIISISTLTSHLSNYLPDPSNKLLLDMVAGTVGPGNFSYWQLGHTGPLVIELTSLSGDADLYVSDTVRPSFEVDRNNFSSATCGQDVVIIPADFPRPIGIGVFGSWTHSVSEYCIHVFLDYAKMQALAMEFHQTNADSSASNTKKNRSPRRSMMRNLGFSFDYSTYLKWFSKW
ncbi:UPF0669 protein C6orf120 homolog isoform X2 [Pararge aegeria]|uniref:UPF0669 protein C6orf120 homolog isoform X2 n=1 Tax=Pararge aegeria TaxID=116150 RepID=UPI0019CF8D7A|nr:UPF0669 protein C6orf120 homolog isoform X2 [Pararge aegeria]